MYYHILIQHTQLHLPQSNITSMSSLNFPGSLCTDQYIPVCTTDVQVHTHHEYVPGCNDAEGPGCNDAELLGQYALQRGPATCKNVSIHKCILLCTMCILVHTKYILIHTAYIHVCTQYKLVHTMYCDILVHTTYHCCNSSLEEDTCQFIVLVHNRYIIVHTWYILVCTIYVLVHTSTYLVHTGMYWRKVPAAN